MIARQGPTVDPLEVPPRPALAAGVQPVGEMQGAGFVDRQWLIQRDGQFIQVSELVYRVVEQLDGERTPDEIAAAVTASTEWVVTAENVRQLVRLKLLPLRLVAAAGGRTGAAADLRGMSPPTLARSPLMLTLRTRVIGPGVIEPITGVLQYLYAPPVLVPALVLIAVAHGWLYVVHGAVGSLLGVLYTPALFLVALAILIAAGVVHEFGHASALRYGGGRVRGMGAGLYLIYPAFYTDVTDSYRLGRWARVRTDLGGFYFHLLFAVGLIGLYFVTRQEFLLFVVLLINLDIARQFLPFVRLDGYWALADLTGIPDFFSQIGPFLRSVLPVRGLPGSRLPALKPWVKAAFAIYIIATIPALGIFFYLMLKGVPQLIALAWDSSFQLIASATDAQRRGDALGAAASAAQVIILAIPVAGTAYVVYSLVWRPARALWRWGQPTAARRALASLALVGAAGGLAALWLPYPPPVGVAPAPAGVLSFEVTERAHVQGRITYAQAPPVGGDHAPVWQNCGFYDTPVASENAVHSMEHGAVWITYRPDVASEQVERLRRLARSRSHVLVSPIADLPAPVVAAAWGRQLPLESADGPRLEAFVRAFRQAWQAPERGGPCTGGVGEPRG